jgi:hypothetical protein
MQMWTVGTVPAEAVPPATLGETVVLAAAAAVVLLWVLRRLLKLLVFLALVVLVAVVLGGGPSVLGGLSRTQEAPAWVSSKPSSRTLARAMEREGVRRPPGVCAHHIVAGAEPRAAPARWVLTAQRVDINDPANGVFLDCPYHQALHTVTYYAEVNRLVAAAPPERVRDVLRVIGANLLARTFPI